MRATQVEVEGGRFMLKIPRSTVEMGFLISAARQFAAAPEGPFRTPSVDGAINWGILYRLADGHGLVPILHHVFSGNSDPAIPAEFRQAIRQRALTAGFHNLNLMRTLMMLLGAFERLDVAVMPLKGLVFASEAYGDLCLRPSGDIDLLVAPEDRLPAEEVLKLSGAVPDVERNPERHSVWRLDGTIIELHAGCETDWCPRRLERDLYFRWRREVDLGPRRVEAFSREGTIIYACSHCASHYVTPFVTLEGLKLSLYLDLALFLRRWRDKLDWVALIEQSERLSSPLIVRPHMIAAMALFDPPVPPEIRRWLMRDREARRMAAEVLRDLARTGLLQADGTRGEVARLGKYRRVCKVYGSRYRGMLHLARTNWEALFTVSQLDRMAFPSVQSTALLVPLRLCRITSSYVVPLLKKRE
jgi:hypothetical protein